MLTLISMQVIKSLQLDNNRQVSAICGGKTPLQVVYSSPGYLYFKIYYQSHRQERKVLSPSYDTQPPTYSTCLIHLPLECLIRLKPMTHISECPVLLALMLTKHYEGRCLILSNKFYHPSLKAVNAELYFL